jgi:hypothetical protein
MIRDPGILEGPILTRDSLVLHRLVKDGAHSLAWFYSGERSHCAGPVGMSEDSPCKYSSAGTYPAGTLIIAEASLGWIGVILDYVDGAGHGNLLTDVLKSIRWV